MPQLGSNEEWENFTTEDDDLPLEPDESEEWWEDVDPGAEFNPGSPVPQLDDYNASARRCAKYLHEEILRGDPLEKATLSGWPDIMEFLLRESGLTEEEFRRFLMFAFRENINNEEHDHLNSVLFLNGARDPAASLKKSAESLLHRYQARLKAAKIKAALKKCP